ncbi:hypothetical protein Gobs01_00094 [Geodermatophilus obscurus DSM 43160]
MTMDEGVETGRDHGPHPRFRGGCEDTLGPSDARPYTSR